MFNCLHISEGTTYRFIVTSIRGDWKFFKQILNLNRYSSAENVCMLCWGSKGRNDPVNNYTNLAPDAPWRSTYMAGPPPWKERPAAAKLDFFDLRRIGLDLLHIWFLGVGRDVCPDYSLTHFVFVCVLFCGLFADIWLIFFAERVGGTMSSLVKSGYFGGGNIQKKLDRAFVCLATFRKQFGLPLSLRKLTADNLCLKKGKFPEA